MAMAARVLGQRRTCKIRVDVLIDLSAAPYTFLVYSMEHEPLSQSLAVLKPFVSNRPKYKLFTSFLVAN